ncbi:hypothetical protein C1646_771742 [Rhizophagus diaphanus]|nr:hypothetical protein C1646_771742 [Rhizophagus diaphanus] [Rhizophagus sp. MUCL 43196]
MNEIAVAEAKEAKEEKKNKQGSQGSQKEKFLEAGRSDDYDEFVSKSFSYLLSNESKYNNSETENKSDAELELEEINANDYNVSFKSEKAQGAGTLLVDVCDFENFKSEYIKLAAAKKVVLIFITMKKKEKLIKRKKKESNSDNKEAICDESIPKTNNNNKVPKISDISVLDQRIAKNVTELRKETWCPMHNRHYLKDCEPHTEISNMMFSTWATEMLNGLATVKEPPTHPSFAYTHPPKNKSQSIILQFSNNIQNSINLFFSNILQTSSQPSSQQTIPSMAKFLHQIDEIEKMENYYFKFLEGFEKQRIKVKHLNKLNDAQFEACGVIAIGDIETIREAAQNYK